MKRQVSKELMTSCLERRGHQTSSGLWKGFRTQIVNLIHSTRKELKLKTGTEKPHCNE